MELVVLARRLWYRRVLVAVGIVLAGLTAAVAPSSPSPAFYSASSRVLLNTEVSQLVRTAPVATDSLPWRTQLLAGLLGTTQVQRRLARRLKVHENELAIVDSALSSPEIPSTMALKASKAAAPDAAAYMLTVGVPDTDLPLIDLQGAAPTHAGASALVKAAIGLMSGRRQRTGTYRSFLGAVGGTSFRYQPLKLQQVAAVHVRRVSQFQPPVKQLGAGLIVLLAWCLGSSRLARRLERRRGTGAPRATHRRRRERAARPAV